MATSIILNAKTVFTLWDLHSADRIPIPEYWTFGRDSVLTCAPAHLLSGLQWLPDDIYVFDESFEWSVIFTHEHEEQDKIIIVAPSGYI
jgi:hypothetical protein